MHRELSDAIRAALLPPENLPGHLWAEANFVIDGRASSFAGDFTTSNVAFTRAPIDAGADNLVESIVLMAAVQSVKSTTMHGILARIPVVDPGPAMWVAQSKDEGEIMFNDRILPSLRRSRLIRDLLPEEERGKITRKGINFASMPFYLAWGGSEKKLQSKPVRWLFLDEPEQYPDMVKEAEDRTTTFWNSRTIYAGTPKFIQGILDREFRKGHQSFWRVFCMKCGKPMKIHFGAKCYEANLVKEGSEWPQGGMRWNEKEPDPWYECEHCEHRHWDTPQTRLHFATNGEQEILNPLAMNPTPDKAGVIPRQKMSYQWGSIVSPIGKSWRHLKTQFEEATYFTKLGNFEFLQEFVNKRLGEPFNPEQYETNWLREPVVYNPLDKRPNESHRFLIADVQDDCLYAIARAADKSTGDSWLLEARRILDFHELREMQLRLSVPDRYTALDCGDREADVWRECARYGWTALKGWGDDNNSHMLKWKKAGKLVASLYKPGSAVEDSAGNEFNEIDWEKVPHHIKKVVFSVPANVRKKFVFMLFASQGAMDMLDALMRGGELIPKWEYHQTAPADYYKHLRNYRRVKAATEYHDRDRRHKWQYRKGEDHYLAAERMAIVLMVTVGILKSAAAES